MITTAQAAKLDTAERKALLLALVAGAGIDQVIEDLRGVCRDLEDDSRDTAGADAWAEIGTELGLAHRTARVQAQAAMGDFAPVGG